MVSYPRYYESDLSPEAIQLRQSEGWISFLSLKQLSELEKRHWPNQTQDETHWDEARWDQARWDQARWGETRWDEIRWDEIPISSPPPQESLPAIDGDGSPQSGVREGILAPAVIPISSPPPQESLPAIDGDGSPQSGVREGILAPAVVAPAVVAPAVVAPADHWRIVQTKHARRTAPIVSMVLLLLGLPFFLDRTPGNVLNDAGKSMIACGLCYAATFVVQNIRPESASALLPWIPIFVFGTLAVVLIDRIRT